MTFSEFADIVTVVSGAMTILGIGGIVSWGFFARTTNALASRIITVFAYSIKTFIAALLVAPAYEIWYWIHTRTILFLHGFIAIGHIYCDSSLPLSYVASYVVSLSLVVPLYSVIVACLYKASLKPVRQIVGALLRKGTP